MFEYSKQPEGKETLEAPLSRGISLVERNTDRQLSDREKGTW
jgi:hypothetical protein